MGTGLLSDAEGLKRKQKINNIVLCFRRRNTEAINISTNHNAQSKSRKGSNTSFKEMAKKHSNLETSSPCSKLQYSRLPQRRSAKQKVRGSCFTCRLRSQLDKDHFAPTLPQSFLADTESLGSQNPTRS